jgi:hypothetical protein
MVINIQQMLKLLKQGGGRGIFIGPFHFLETLQYGHVYHYFLGFRSYYLILENENAIEPLVCSQF